MGKYRTKEQRDAAVAALMRPPTRVPSHDDLYTRNLIAIRGEEYASLYALRTYPPSWPKHTTLRVPRFRTLPKARWLTEDATPEVADIIDVEVPVVHHAGPYHVADVHDLGEWHVIDIRTGKADFRTTDRVLACMVADSFHREGL